MTITHPGKILMGSATTALCFAGAFLLLKFAPEMGAAVPKMIMLVGIVAVAIPTFEWGAVLGYRIQDQEGRFLIGHIVRCTVMAAIMVGAAWFVGAAIAVIAFASLK